MCLILCSCESVLLRSQTIIFCLKNALLPSDCLEDMLHLKNRSCSLWSLSVLFSSSIRMNRLRTCHYSPLKGQGSGDTEIKKIYRFGQIISVEKGPVTTRAVYPFRSSSPQTCCTSAAPV